MSFTGISELKPFAESAEKFAKNELEPGALEADNYPYARFNENALKIAQQLGFLKIILPEKYGGLEQGIPALCEVLATLSQVDASFSCLIFTTALAQSLLLKSGSEQVKEKYLAQNLFAFPVYDSLTDLQKEIEASKTNQGYILNGKIEYLALAPLARAMIIPARLKGTEETGFFLIDARTPGVKLSEPVLSLGLRQCPVADLELKEVKLEADQLLLPDAEKEYPGLARKFYPAVLAMALGVVFGSYQTAKEYAKERYQGGRMIIDYDQIRMMLVNMAVIIECGKALLKELLNHSEKDYPHFLSDSALILLTEQTSKATTDGVQILGGYGYIQDYGQEKRMRDAKQIQLIFGSVPFKRLQLMAGILAQEEWGG